MENAGYRVSENKSDLFKTLTERIGNKIEHNRIRPVQVRDKSLAIKELKKPENEKYLNYFSGAIQYFSKFIENLPAQTDVLGQVLKNNNGWKLTEKHTEAFEI